MDINGKYRVICENSDIMCSEHVHLKDGKIIGQMFKDDKNVELGTYEFKNNTITNCTLYLTHKRKTLYNLFGHIFPKKEDEYYDFFEIRLVCDEILNKKNESLIIVLLKSVKKYEEKKNRR